MIHDTAIIGKNAQLGERVTVGPYTVIDDHAVIGDDCRIGPRVTITGHTTIGKGTNVHSGAVIGDEPQDHGYRGEVSYTQIGRRCVLREYVTIHRGAAAESTTVIGDDVMIMGLAHVGHNCRIGSHVNIANATLLAGHVEIEDRAFLSARIMVHQFVRLGTLAMIGGGAIVAQDVPPYCLVPRQLVRGPNTVGLKRAGLSADTRQAVKHAIKLYFFSGLNGTEALAAIREQHGASAEVAHFADFIEASRRGVLSAVSRKHHKE